MRRAAGLSVGALVALVLCGCAGTSPAPQAAGSSEPAASTPASTVNRVRVTNDGPAAVSDLELLFPVDAVAVGDVATGATSDYVEVPHGVYHYSAFAYTVDGKRVTQPVIDFVGESPMPLDDYTYLIHFDPKDSFPAELVTVLRTSPDPSATQEAWVRVRNEGPDDLAGCTLLFPDDQRIHLGTIPAGTTTQYAQLYGGVAGVLTGVEYQEDGTTVRQQAPPPGTSPPPTAGPPASGTLTFVLGYTQGAPDGQPGVVREA